MHQADAVSDSKAALEAKKYAPQAHANAEKLRAEAQFLQEDGRSEEAAVAADQAIAAYSEAFALVRIAKAEERLEASTATLVEAEREVAKLDMLQTQVAADADAFEMRARVHLDTEALKDVDTASPERLKARQIAARQLSAEAGLLCLAARLLDEKVEGIAETQAELAVLDKELVLGSVKKDLYPRATEARSECLRKLTLTRRAEIQNSPDSGVSDRLFKELTESGKVFAYRDDRGIVVNIASVLDEKGILTPSATETLNFLGATAKNHQKFPIMLITHTKKRGQEARAEEMSSKATKCLEESGAPSVAVQSVADAQPLVSPRVTGAAEKNERVEVVFVVSGR